MSKPGKVLKAMCKKLGVRLTIKRGQKRVHKSVAVLKRQCANKKKKKKKVVKRRKARFGAGRINFNAPLYDYGENNLMSSLNNQRRKTQAAIRLFYPRAGYQKPLGNNNPEYFGSGYNPFDIDNFSKNLLNDSIHDPRKMVALILDADGDSLGTKSINYLIHNDFFKTRDENNQMIESYDTMLLSDYILGNYHKKVPLKREDIGTPLVDKARRVCIENTDVINETQVRVLVKRYLWHDDLYDINWNNPDGSYPILTGVKTEKYFRRESVIKFIVMFGRYPTIRDLDRDWIIARTRWKFENRQPIPVDEILQEINDREIKAKDFFIKEHMSKYTNEVINNTNNLESRWGRYHFVNRGDDSVFIESFLKKKLKDYIFLCHRLRVQMLSHDTIKNTKNNGDISYNFTTNDALRLCTCEDFYYRKFSNNRAGRICKHLASTPRATDNFELNPPILLPGFLIENEDGTTDDITPTKQMFFNILRLERPEMLEDSGIDLDDESYFGSPYVIEGVVRQRREISREIMEGLIDRNIVRSGEDHCYICLERPNFVIKNCPGQCKRSKICLDCIKQYPQDWYNDITKVRCGMCREPLRDGQIVDFNIMKRARNFNQDIIDKIGADLQLNRIAPGLAKYVRSRPGGQVYFGKKKKKVGIPASLKKVCKRLKIRLTVKRKGKRVYKSVKVLKGQCKKGLKKNSARKKIKRGGIMATKRKSKAGKKVKKKISVSLKNKCKKYGIRLTFKKGNKKVPKSEKLLIKQLKKKEIVLKKKGDNAIKKLIKKVKILKKKEIKRRKEKGIKKKINKKDIKRMVQASKPPSMMGRIWKQIKRSVVFLFTVLAETGKRRREKEERLKTISAQIRHLNNEAYSLSRDLR